MEPVFLSGVVPPEGYAGGVWWFAVRGGQILVRGEGAETAVPFADGADGSDALGLASLSPLQYLGALGDTPCYAVTVAGETPPPDGFAFVPLRELFGRLPDWAFAVAGKAVQVVAWERTHRFCGQCGTPTEQVPGERATRCPNCGLTNFPRLSPATIVRIERGPELLLARGKNFPPGMYSNIAGFVEPGESLEETVAREVREEVGVEVMDIRYFASQPWPYPNSLMLGFTATYVSGEIRADETEIADARWFRWDALPNIPPPLSIARRLIDDFVARQRGDVSLS